MERTKRNRDGVAYQGEGCISGEQRARQGSKLCAMEQAMRNEVRWVQEDGRVH